MGGCGSTGRGVTGKLEFVPPSAHADRRITLVVRTPPIGGRENPTCFSYVQHHHSGLGLLTPADVHHNRAPERVAARSRVLEAADAL